MNVQWEEYVLPEEFYNAEDDVVILGGAFLKGMRLYDHEGYETPFWQNTSDCFYAATNFTWVDFPVWLSYVQGDSEIYGVYNKYITTALYLQTLSEALSICNTMNKNAYQYINIRRALFSFSWVAFIQGFLQNVLGSYYVSIENIIANLGEA